MNINDTIHGFRVKERIEIDEISAVLWRMEYEKCGTPLYFLEREDENKTFSISFKTIPEDSTGVFHIIEHSVLCGSDKYPVKEPFVELLKSSLQTFLNAMTYPDKTVYPISTRNNKDFLNLMSVYLDAVLHPAILSNKNIFLQEGWHYEIDEDGRLNRSGVVLNEMRGAFSSADEVAMREISEMLFADVSYRHESGGDPRCIPELTYEGFLAAHAKYYHPSNAEIFLDGAVDLDAALGLIDSYLSEYEPLGEVFTIEKQKPLPPSEKVIEYEIAENESPENKERLAVGILAFDFDDEKRALALDLTLTALTASNESPLKKAILDTGLCEDMNIGLNEGMRQSYVGMDFRNVMDGKCDELYRIFNDEVRRICTEGIDRSILEATLNGIDFRMRERDSGNTPEGIIFATSILNYTLYGGDPVSGIAYFDVAREVRAELESEDYFEKLLSSVLLECDHRAVLKMIPSPTLGAERTALERAELDRILSEMSDEETEEIREMNRRLSEWQQTPDSPERLATIPTLTLDDIPREPERIPEEVSSFSDVTVLTHDIQTNGIIYTSHIFDASDISPEELFDLRILCSLYMNVRTEDLSAIELQKKITSELGSFEISAVPRTKRNGEVKLCVHITASALTEKAVSIPEILEEVVYSSDFTDIEVIRNILKQMKMSDEDFFTARGNVAGFTRAAACVSAEFAMREYYSGYESYTRLKALLSDLDREFPALSERLMALTKKIFTKERLLLSLTGKDASTHTEAMLAPIRSGEACAPVLKFEPFGIRHEGILIPAQIGYAAMCSCRRDIDAPPSGSHAVAWKILSYGYLWNEVRVQGGAYGVGVRSRGNSGLIYYYSYRDPSPARSVSIYKGAGAFLRDLARSETDLTKFIIGAIGDDDPLMNPRRKGASATNLYINGTTYEDLVRIREEVLGTDADELIRIADMLDTLADRSATVIIGGKDKLDSCADIIDTVLEI